VIKVWGAHDLAEAGCAVGHYNWIRCLHIKGNYLYSGGDDKTIKVWDKSTLRCTSTLPNKSGAVHSIVTVGDNVISGTSTNAIHVWGP
jgi:WD40 repeat protein